MPNEQAPVAARTAPCQLPDPPAPAERWRLLMYAHTHWDREWYQPFERFRMQLVAAIDAILNVLDTDDRFTAYVLDGQTIVLDDYLALRPERHDELAQLIASGRIEVGPWYILPDEFLVSGESLVRNLLEGRRGALRFGRPMSVGYLPDPFGHVAQMPQILQGFDIDTIVFSRGMGDEFSELGSEFLWRAPDGESCVLGIVQSGVDRTNGYCNAMLLSQVHDPDDPRIADLSDRLAQRLAGLAHTPVLHFAAGCDHETINPYLPDMVEALQERYDNADVEIVGLAQIARETRDFVREQLERGVSPGTYTGELRGALLAPILGGIFSARIALKQQNTQLQTMLERYVEPLAAIAAAQGAHVTPTEFLRHAWRLTLQNQPHDSIGGCSVDAVHDEMPARTLRALSLCQGMLEEIMIGAGEDERAVVFNPHPDAFSGLARTTRGELVAVADVPPLGVVALDDVAATTGARATGDAAIESDAMRVSVHEGTVRVALLRDGDELVAIDDALQFRDVADAGDEYDWGHVDGDTPIVARLIDAKSRIGDHGVAELVLCHALDLPEALAEDRRARSHTTIEHELTTVLRVADGQPWVECETAWVNHARDHLLRVRVHVGGAADPVSRADGHFAVTERPIVPVPARGEWTQAPLTAQHCEHLASVEAADHTRGVAVFTRGLNEYECTIAPDAGDTFLDVTLLRSVGWLSRPDIVGRPGDAGPALPTPGAQCIGALRVEYAIAPYAGDWQSARLPQLARRFAAPALVVEPVLPQVSRGATGHEARVRDIRAAGDTPPPGAMGRHGLRVEGLELSALKPADDGSGDVVVRGYNPYRTTVTATLHPGSFGDRVVLAGLDELPTADGALDLRDGMVSIDVPPAGIRTFRIASA